jgi:hypothetical protein
MGVASAQLGLGGSDLLNRRFDSHTFLENKGQWDSRALFVSSQPGYNFWVTREGFKVDFYKLQRTEGGSPESAGLEGRSGSGFERTGTVINFKFVGAGLAAEPWGFAPSSTKFDFFVGAESQHARGVRSYKEAYVKALSPGVHMRNYFDGKQNRYDIVVEPGVDPSQVMFDVLGADSVSVQDEKLVINTYVGPVTQDKVLAYQPIGNAQRVVPARFKQVGANRVGFEIGSYDPRLPLIIDPLVYGTYVGSDAVPLFSTGYEQPFSAHADDEGNLFVTGETSSITFPITDGPYGFSLNGALDSFLIRMAGDAYDTSYVAYLGGSGSEFGTAISMDRNTGDLWIAGRTTSADFPGTGGSGTALTGANDVFLAKFNVDNIGNVAPVSSRYYSPAGDGVTAIDLVVGPTGEVYLSGRNTGLTFTSYIPAAPGGGADGFVTKLNSSGVVQWERKVGSTANDGIGKIDVDAAGNVVMVGSFGFTGTQDTATAPAPAFHTTAGVYPEGRLIRSGDIFVVKMDSSGTTQFACLVGGSLFETAYAAAFDFEGSVYVGGATSSFDYPRNAGAYSETPAGSLTMTKLASDGTALRYSTGLRTTGTIAMTGIDVDGRGMATIGGVVGWTYGALPGNTIPGTITVVDPIDGVYDDGAESYNGIDDPADCFSTTDGFVIFLNSSGSDVPFADYIGQASDDRVNDVLSTRSAPPGSSAMRRPGSACSRFRSDAQRHRSGSSRGSPRTRSSPRPTESTAS